MADLKTIVAAAQRRSKRPLAVVVNNGDANSYGVIANLGIAGVPAISVSSDPSNLTFRSRYAQAALSPDFMRDESGFIDYMIRLGRLITPKPVLFVNGDEQLLVLLRHREQLQAFYHIPFADFALANQLTDKTEFYRLLEKLGIPHARAYLPETAAEVATLADQMRFPCIIKPSQSQTFSTRFGNKCLPVDTRDELIQRYNEVAAEEKQIIIQERIEGTERYLIYTYFNAESEPLAVLVYKKLRIYPIDFGNATVCRTVIDPDLQHQVLEMMRTLKCRGLAEAEAQRDARDGCLKLVEINARSTTQSRLSARAYVNMEYIAYLDMLGTPLTFRANNEPGILWIDLYRDLLAIFGSDGYRSQKRIGILEWLKSLRGSRVFAFCSLTDPMPSLVLFLRLFRMYAFTRKRLADIGSLFRRLGRSKA